MGVDLVGASGGMEHSMDMEEDPIEQVEGAVPAPPPPPVMSFDHDRSSRAYTAFRLVFEAHVRPAVARLIEKLRRAVPGLTERVGLPDDPPPSDWTLAQCVEALARVWGHEAARWEGRALGVYTDRRKTSSSSPPPTVPPPTPRAFSRHAPAPPTLPCPSAPAQAWHPPSPRHVREVLLPRLFLFFSPRAALPSEEEWVEALEAAQTVLGGHGARMFFVTSAAEEKVRGAIDGAWEEVEKVRLREMSYEVE